MLSRPSFDVLERLRLLAAKAWGTRRRLLSCFRGPTRPWGFTTSSEGRESMAPGDPPMGVYRRQSSRQTHTHLTPHPTVRNVNQFANSLARLKFANDHEIPHLRSTQFELVRPVLGARRNMDGKRLAI